MTETFEPKYELVPADDPILREEQTVFDFQSPPTDPIELAHELVQHMMYYDGMGLAAPQLGLPYRVFAVRAKPNLVIFNPEVVDFTDEEIKLEEGCLTFPNLFMKVKRPKSIKVRYDEPNGSVQTKVFTGMTARIFLHEMDHLDGILFIDRVSDLTLKMAKKKSQKYKRGYDFSKIDPFLLDNMSK
jgi:peptide deformylase